jgi:predicted ATP-binding protein involved in virulence
MKIKEITIKGLYEKYNFHWILNYDTNHNVNILEGDNGSFKTTILNIILSLLRGTLLRNTKYENINSVDIILTDNCIIEYRILKDNLLSIRKKAEEDDVFKSLKNRLEADYANKSENELVKMNLSGDILMIKKDDNIISTDDFLKLIKLDFISTFDRPLEKETGDDKSSLDIKLGLLEAQYAYYLSDLSKILTDNLEKEGKIDEEKYKQIYFHRNKFIEIVNKSFESSHKILDKDASKLEFILLDNKQRIGISNLSSGEKQLLIILLTVLLEKEEEAILIMDEPEISMHIEWQKVLINNIKELNPSCQLILTTHSPGIILEGWELLVKPMREITVYNKEL